MLAYTAHRRTHRQLSPATLVGIVGVHAVALTLVAMAKMGVPIIPKGPDTQIYNVPLKPPPPPTPPPPQPQVETQTTKPPPPDSHIEVVPPVLPLQGSGPSVDFGPSSASNPPDIGPSLVTPLDPGPIDPPKPAVVHQAARFATPADLVRPPYPESKRRSEEEATLRLSLSVDERGRVTAVNPVGAADPAFVAAARAHLLRYWRYKPATDDGRPVTTNLVVTLKFELEE